MILKRRPAEGTIPASLDRRGGLRPPPLSGPGAEDAPHKVKDGLPERICCIGAGYVGGPTMAVIASRCPGIEVSVVDADPERIAAWNSGDLPVFEPGLGELVEETRGRNLFFSADVDREIERSEMIFICVNTPTKEYGEGAGKASDLKHVERCARRIAAIGGRARILVEKSTVPVRTAQMVREIVGAGRPDVQVLSNPEFMAEGTAVRDLLSPDRILIGAESGPEGDRAAEALAAVYRQWVDPGRILLSGLWSSELSKLASNAFLAQRISSINAISALCERTQADVQEVAQAVGRDRRIGPEFLRASVGFGGSCFRKDVLSLVYLCERFGLPEEAAYWEGVLRINEHQKDRFASELVRALFSTVSGKRIAILGFAFKKDTNDTRESPAIGVCRRLLEERARLAIHDPRVREDQVRRELGGGDYQVAGDPYQACEGSHALAVLADWDQYLRLDYRRIHRSMEKPAVLFDGRNLLDLEAMRGIGFQVRGIGKACG